ncbi:hypothetical protein [Methylobacterium sp. E-066]|uniref:hypothetical protein n=1 Tax=Methylobacterium sp. E-066 TaxID=2836584 RepID=UPI001FB94FBA|nr:hypothetical protein [Methylobacterium sp. E-066]MCJ2140274.1 hypothetical protein [Methylobacterium sp. E-066]
MAGLLRDIQPGRVYVDCSSCKRSGRYTVASLRERFGLDVSTLDVLRHLMASCRYQRAPGSPPARKYEHLCLAAITLPPPIRPEIPVPPGVPYTVEVWTETGSIEVRLAVIYPIDMARAAFEVACQLWPKHEVTLRDRCRIVEKRERPEAPTRAAPVASLLP